MGVNGDAMVVRDASEGYFRQATLPVGYRQTEVGVIPEDWDVSTLSGIATVSSGATPARSSFDRYYRGGSIPWVKTLDLTNKEIAKTDELVTRAALKDTALRMYPKGTVLVAMYGGYNQIGRTGYLAFPATTNQALSAIVSQEEKIYPKYLLYVLNYRVDYWKSVASSSRKDPNITGNDVRNFLIPLPSVYEQRAIAAALSDVDALLEGLDRLIAKKRDLKQAVMQQLLTGQTRLPGFEQGWVSVRLGELGKTYGGLTGKTKADFGAGEAFYVPFVNVMENVVIDCDAFERVRLEPGEPQNLVKSGDLLFNGSSETPEELAMCALMDAEYSNLYLNSFCFGFRLHEQAQVSSLFLAYYIRSHEGRELIKSLAQGSTRYNLSKSALLSASITIPSFEEQCGIAAVLSDLDAELEALEERHAKTFELKQAMMQELLTGRTRLVEPEKEETAC